MEENLTENKEDVAQTYESFFKRTLESLNKNSYDVSLRNTFGWINNIIYHIDQGSEEYREACLLAKYDAINIYLDKLPDQTAAGKYRSNLSDLLKEVGAKGSLFNRSFSEIEEHFSEEGLERYSHDEAA